MELYFLIKFLHILGACVLIGTGSGIAFFMVMANQTHDARTIAATARIVVIADFVFTLTAALAQPLTGAYLVQASGWSWGDFWIVGAIVLYVLIGVFWIPVIFIQKNMARLAKEALSSQTPLPARYHRLYKIWFWCGVPAFTAILLLLWLMVAKPV